MYKFNHNSKNMNVEYYDDEDEKVSSKNKLNKYLVDIRKINKIKFSEAKLTFDYVIVNFTKAEDGNEGYLSAYSEFSFIEYKFQKINGIFPNVLRLESISGDKFIGNLFKYHQVPPACYAQYTYQDTDDPKMNGFLLSFRKDLLLYFDADNSCALYYNKQLEKDKLFLTVLGLLKYCKNPKVTKNKIYIVYRNAHGFDKIGFDVNKINVDLEENYNEGFKEISTQIITGLNSKHKTNLVILSGDPGTGKCVVGNTKITVRNKKTGKIEEIKIKDLM